MDYFLSCLRSRSDRRITWACRAPRCGRQNTSIIICSVPTEPSADSSSALLSSHVLLEGLMWFDVGHGIQMGDMGQISYEDFCFPYPAVVILHHLAPLPPLRYPAPER